MSLMLALLAAIASGRAAAGPAKGAANVVAGPMSGDPPEPTQPQDECTFTRRVFCQPGTATRKPLQASPFGTCRPAQPARFTSLGHPKNQARFSAAETRKTRRTSPRACCYVEFDATECD